MPKTPLRTSFILTTALLGACFSGPNQLEYYEHYNKALALTVHAHFADPPTGIAADPILAIAKVPSPPWDFEQQGDLLPIQWEIPGVMKAGGDAQFTVNAGSWIEELHGDFSPLRFFRLGVGFYKPLMSIKATWTPAGYDLVWAKDISTYFPFGPAYPSVTFPKGYSWLRRRCGPAPGQIQMDVRPIEETVVFQHVDQFLLWDSFYLESAERRFVETCGAITQTQDLGTRISFDRASTHPLVWSTERISVAPAQPLVWSTDSTSLYYLSEAGEQDPTKTVGLRQIRLADGVSSELVAVSLGRNLQQDANGQLYVTTGSELALVSRAENGLATLIDLPFPGTGRVSPDGQWIARYNRGGIILWSVSAFAEVAVFGGKIVDWSPDSMLAYLTGDPQVLNLISPTNPTIPTAYPTMHQEEDLAWSTQGPVLAHNPEDLDTECNSCLGLTLNNLVEGSERKVLDASVGRIHLLSAPPVLDTYLVWAKKCLGLHNTVCSYSLIRINLTTGATQTVAVAPDRYPIGLSPDGKRLATATPNGIYVKTLSP